MMFAILMQFNMLFAILADGDTVVSFFECTGHAWTSDYGCSDKEEDFHNLIKYVISVTLEESGIV